MITAKLDCTGQRAAGGGLDLETVQQSWEDVLGSGEYAKAGWRSRKRGDVFQLHGKPRSLDMDQDVDTRILSQRLQLSTDADMYRPAGYEPLPPPTTTTTTTPQKMHRSDLLRLYSQRSNSSTVAELMRKLKEEGWMDRPPCDNWSLDSSNQSAGSSWLRRPDKSQDHSSSPQAGGHRFIQNAQHLARLAEATRQPQKKSREGLDMNVAVASTRSLSPASEKLLSSDAELKRTESMSSEDLVELEMVTPGGGRSGRPRRKITNPHVSKNLVSERKRRKKLNDGLYSLRALVPKISKMDKASIVGDAIDYVRELKQEVEEIELEISDLERRAVSHANESSAAGDSGMVSDSCEERASVGEEANEAGVTVVTEPEVTEAVAMEAENTKPLAHTPQVGQPPVLETRILNMEVDKLDEQMYQLKISCQNGPGVLVQLTQALESLDLDVLNTYHTSFKESLLNTFIVEMKNLDMKEAEDVRRTLLDVAARHGLVQT